MSQVVLNLGLEITNRCMNYCTHCYLSCTETGVDMSYEKINTIVNKFDDYKFKNDNDDYTFQIITLTGGDPFLYLDSHKNKNLFDIVENLKKKQRIVIHVALWLKKPEVLDVLRKFNNQIIFSIGYTTFTPSYYDKFYRTFMDLEPIAKHLYIDVTAKNDASSEKNELINFFRTREYSINIVRDDLITAKKDIDIDINFKKVYAVGRAKEIQDIREDKVCIYETGHYKKDHYFLYIDVHGDVYPCGRALATFLPKIGNIFNDSREVFCKKFLNYKLLKERFCLEDGNTCFDCKNKFKYWYDNNAN